MKTQFNEFYQGQGLSKVKLEGDGSGMADGWGNDDSKYPTGHGDGLHILHSTSDYEGKDTTSEFYDDRF